MPTICDVAKGARVAPVTVSRVINRSGNVSPETQARVELAIAELGYVPNYLARSLRLKRSNTLALVVTDITNPSWTTVVRGVEDAAQDAGFSVILCNTDESESKQEQYLDALFQKQVDGILLVPASSNSGAINWIQKQHTPVVIIIALLGQSHTLTNHNRVTCYQEMLETLGVPVEPKLVHKDIDSRAEAYRAAQTLLQSSCPPSAIVTSADILAIGVLWGCTRSRRACSRRSGGHWVREHSERREHLSPTDDHRATFPRVQRGRRTTVQPAAESGTDRGSGP